MDCNTNSDVSTTETLYNKWEIWEETGRNWIQAKRGVTNLLLYYFIHKDTSPLTMDNSELIIFYANLATSVFKVDIRKVANLLTPLVLDTDAFEWGGRKFIHIKVSEGWLDLVNN